MNRFHALLGSVLAAVLLYTGLWYTAGMKVQKDIVATMDGWRNDGMKVDHGRVKLEGFPYRLMITIDAPRVGTRSHGFGFKAKTLTLVSHLWTPGHWMAEAWGVEANAAADAWEMKDGYVRASYRTHEDGRPIIVVDSYNTEDFTLEKAPGLKAPTSLDGWQLFLRPGKPQDAKDTGLYESHFLDFKVTAEKNGAQFEAEGGISGPVIADWTEKQLATWRDAGGLLEFDALSLSIPNARLKGNGSVSLDENFMPLGSISLDVAGGKATADWLKDTFGLDAGSAFGGLGTKATPVSVMLQNGQAMVGGMDLTALKPVIGD